MDLPCLDKDTVLVLDDTEKERKMKEGFRKAFTWVTTCPLEDVLVTEFVPKDLGSDVMYSVPARSVIPDMVPSLESAHLQHILLKAALSQPDVLNTLEEYNCVGKSFFFILTVLNT